MHLALASDFLHVTLCNTTPAGPLFLLTLSGRDSITMNLDLSPSGKFKCPPSGEISMLEELPLTLVAFQKTFTSP